MLVDEHLIQVLAVVTRVYEQLVLHVFHATLEIFYRLYAACRFGTISFIFFALTFFSLQIID